MKIKQIVFGVIVGVVLAMGVQCFCGDTAGDLFRRLDRIIYLLEQIERR